MRRAVPIAALIAILGMSACTTTSTAGRTMTSVIREPINELERDPVPGTVNDVWVEPMYNSVRIPGQLDPRGNYYRAGHTGIGEIRPGRFQLGEYPDDREVPEAPSDAR